MIKLFESLQAPIALFESIQSSTVPISLPGHQLAVRTRIGEWQ